MKVAIVGSRNWQGQYQIGKYVESLPPDTEVVSGGARGVDMMAEHAARKRGLKVTVFLADWDKYGKAAGFLRNGQIVAHADKVVAFWDGKSRGTLDTIQKARAAGKDVEIYK